MLAARLVGPTGVERSPEQVALARTRVAELGLHNVRFREGDVTALDEIVADHPVPVDAVIGRLILMWVPDRRAVLAACARSLPAGALVCFLEVAVPSGPLGNRVYGWVLAALDCLGAEKRMGPQLYWSFRQAGLPAPAVAGRIIAGGGAAAPVWVVVNVVRTMLPVLEQAGVVTAAEVDVDTLAARLTAELQTHDAVFIVPPLTAAWARIPG